MLLCQPSTVLPDARGELRYLDQMEWGSKLELSELDQRNMTLEPGSSKKAEASSDDAIFPLCFANGSRVAR